MIHRSSSSSLVAQAAALVNSSRRSSASSGSSRSGSRPGSRSGSQSSSRLSSLNGGLNSGPVSPVEASGAPNRVNASAAARASLAQPINVQPRVPLSSRFVQSLSQGLRREEAKRAAEERRLAEQRAAASAMALNEAPKMPQIRMDPVPPLMGRPGTPESERWARSSQQAALNAVSSNSSLPSRQSFDSARSAGTSDSGNSGHNSGHNSALSAALSAGTRVEANMANIHMQVNEAVRDAQAKRNRRELMKQYMPAASWSAPKTRLRLPANFSNFSLSTSSLQPSTPSSNAKLGTPLSFVEAEDYFRSGTPIGEHSRRSATPVHDVPGEASVETPVGTPVGSSIDTPFESPVETAGTPGSHPYQGLVGNGSMFGGVPGPHPDSPEPPVHFYSSSPSSPGPSIYQPVTTQRKPSARLPHTLRTNPRKKPGQAGPVSASTSKGASSGVPSTPVPSTPVPSTPVASTPVVPQATPRSGQSQYAALGLGYNNLGLGLEPTPRAGSGAAPSPQVAPTPMPTQIPRLPLTLRPDAHRRFNEERPWKGHKSQTDLTERERKRYESLWMANRGTHLSYLAVPEQYQTAWEEAVAVFFASKERRPGSSPSSGNGSGSNGAGLSANSGANAARLAPAHSHRSARSVASVASFASVASTDEKRREQMKREEEQREREEEQRERQEEQLERQVEQVERHAEWKDTDPAEVQVERSELLDTLPKLADDTPAGEPADSATVDSATTDSGDNSSAVLSAADDDATSIASDESEVEDPLEIVARRANDVHGYSVSRLWRRSRLPEDTLAQIWDLVDNNKDGTLDHSGFVIGMWLCDQCLYGRKLPPKIAPELWQSAGKLNLKIRVKPRQTKIGQLRKLPNFLGRTMGYTMHGGRKAVKKAVQTATS